MQGNTATKELIIIDGPKYIGGLLMFTGEAQDSKTYNVCLTFEDLEAYLGVEGLEGAYFKDQTEGIDFKDHAQSILEAWQRGGTTYEVQVIAQKLKGYKFERKTGGFNSFGSSSIINPLAFQLKNNYKSYSPIFG